MPPASPVPVFEGWYFLSWFCLYRRKQMAAIPLMATQPGTQENDLSPFIPGKSTPLPLRKENSVCQGVTLFSFFDLYDIVKQAVHFPGLWWMDAWPWDPVHLCWLIYKAQPVQTILSGMCPRAAAKLPTCRYSEARTGMESCCEKPQSHSKFW